MNVPETFVNISQTFIKLYYSQYKQTIRVAIYHAPLGIIQAKPSALFFFKLS